MTPDPSTVIRSTCRLSEVFEAAELCVRAASGSQLDESHALRCERIAEAIRHKITVGERAVQANAVRHQRVKE